MPSETVLVTDGDQRSALAATRSLGRAGFRVVVAAPGMKSLAGASRWTHERVPAPNPLHDPAGFADRIAEAAARTGAAVILPMTDQSLLALLPRRGDLGGAIIPAPDLDRQQALADKARVMAAAARLGIGVPAQHLLEVADAAGLSGLAFPLVVKPVRSVVATAGGHLRLGVRYAASMDQLVEELNDLPPEAFPVLLQERIVGPGVGVFLLLHEGRELARFAHRRIREKPPSGGVSVYRESIPMPTGLAEQSLALLREFDWSGVAMVEYKLDRAGRPWIMEINGRFWGSLQLAVDAGVDFPVMLVESALGRPVAPVAEWRIGVRSRWWLGEVDHLLARFRRTDRDLALPPGSPSRGRAVLEFLKLWRPGDRAEVFRWNDPRPQFRELAEWVRGR